MKPLARESGTALIWISHDLATVSSLADRVLVMYAGRIVESGPVGAVLRAPLHPYTRGLLDSLPAMAAPGADAGPDPRQHAVAARAARRAAPSRRAAPMPTPPAHADPPRGSRRPPRAAATIRWTA